jgi:hypothetical protein
MFDTIQAEIIGTKPYLEGFKFWWLKSVIGYDLNVHCARCLRGPYERQIHKSMRTNIKVELRGDLVYLCGVSPRWQTNFHAAAEIALGETFDAETYNGFIVRFYNARQLDIPALPDGWRGLPKAFTTCRNFQFAVARSGDSADITSS